jgi:hypothetical protein
MDAKDPAPDDSGVSIRPHPPHAIGSLPHAVDSSAGRRPARPIRAQSDGDTGTGSTTTSPNASAVPPASMSAYVAAAARGVSAVPDSDALLSSSARAPASTTTG